MSLLSVLAVLFVELTGHLASAGTAVGRARHGPSIRDVFAPYNSQRHKAEEKVREHREIQFVSHSVQQMEDIYRKTKKPAAIVQVGAPAGFSFEYATLWDGLHSIFNETAHRGIPWVWILVEPMATKELRNKIKAVQSQYPRGRVILHESAVTPQATGDTETKTFYTFAPTVDPVSGWDSHTGVQLPKYVGRLSSLDKRLPYDNLGQFLDQWNPLMKDKYVAKDFLVEKQVRVSSLDRVLSQNDLGPDQLAVLSLDVEDLDCKLLKATNFKTFTPASIIYHPRYHCGDLDRTDVRIQLSRKYNLVKLDMELELALRK